MRRRFAVAIALVALGGVRCRVPTTLRVSTLSEVDCSKRARVAIVVAHDVPSLKGVVPSAFSTTCVPTGAGDNDTGTVVLTPASGDDGTIALAVMTRPDGESPESCLDATQTGQCIIARRQLRFAPHVALDVPIELRLSCLGVSCAETQTCRKGQCVDATLPAGCAGCGEGDLIGASAPAALATACGDTGGLQAGAPWPMAGLCPTRAGRSGRLGPQTPAIRWRFKTGGIASMSPAVSANGTIYVGGNDRQLHAVSPTGTELWHADLASNINDTGVVIGADGTVSVGCADQQMHAFSPDGKAKWSTPVEGDVAWTPVAGGDGTIFINGLPAPTPLFALRSDGTVKWRKAGPFGASAVAIGLDGTIFAGGNDLKLHALSPTDGAERWAAATTAAPATPSVGSDGTVYVTDAQSAYAFDPTTGARRWAVPVGLGATGLALGPDDTVYVAQRDGKLVAIRANGTVRWTFDSGSGGFREPPAVGSDGTAYLGGDDSAVYAISADGKLLWKAQTGNAGINSQPAIGSDGTLYILSNDSFLNAIGP